jgi:transcriptional regulator with XRE-family HTH domain
MKEYGEYFRSMRLSIGYTQKQFARLLDVFPTTYYRWEKAVIIPQQDIYEIEIKLGKLLDQLRKLVKTY